MLRNSVLVSVTSIVCSVVVFAGCKNRRTTQTDKGKVDVNVTTPAGDYGVHVDYPKDKDHHHDSETKVKVEHK